MPVHDTPTIDLVGRSTHGDALRALREALGEILRGLAAAGCGPHHLVAMVWEAPDPAAVHPSRHAVDLAYREVLVGFRPPITLRPADGRSLVVRATARRPAAPPPEPVWGDLTLPALAREYSARGQVPDMQAVFDRWTRDGEAFRAGRGGLDLAYGPGPYGTLDLYRPAGVARPPLWVFLHGGYWQAADKAQHAQFARGMLDAGFAVAMPNYGLAPETPLATIAEQVLAALRFLVREADALGCDAARLHLAGHSAGAHLAALMAARPDAPPVRSALLLSGLFELAPLALLPMGQVLGLTSETAVAQLSPARMAPRPGTRLGLALGGLESGEFQRQSARMAAAWGAPAPLVVDGAHHFSLLDGLNGGPLLALARATAAG